MEILVSPPTNVIFLQVIHLSREGLALDGFYHYCLLRKDEEKAKLKAQCENLILQIAQLHSNIKKLLDSPLISQEAGKCTCTLT